MRNRMERLRSFPFSVGCISHRGVNVANNQPKKYRIESDATRTSEIQSNSRMKTSFLPTPKMNISKGIQQVIKSFKNLSNFFKFHKEEADDDDEYIEMEIGFPTDVQHVAHIGWDGMKSCDKSHDLLSLHTISMKQSELAMAARADGPH
ncbi:uncharacterized protein A4U43_C04F23310 [Asparagus officinalis]|uniref:CRIB domain-containing protein n=1 Tax=Asparagus officinalis TaxID=4686 RepID=A0A5P1F3R9_ASPOF|nr:CRIB domain-containing protein RIC4-like [Asparagus officinalis]ONK72794.1 uncharacterized protein A4U43_C04F23310 [Asparagus officinalis]